MNGYTWPVAEGCSFAEFVWRCARAMHQLSYMRDDSSSSPIRLPATDNRLRERIEATRAEIEELKNASYETCKRLEYQERTTQLAADLAWYQTAQQRLGRLRKMRKAVEYWSVEPAFGFEELRKFMLDTLEVDIRYESERTCPSERPRLSPNEWRHTALGRLSCELQRDVEEFARIEEDHVHRLAWLNHLMKAVPIPEHMLASDAGLSESP